MTIREIVLDTETTGLYSDSGDRIIEIGCIELIDRCPTGRVLHEYLNPKRIVPHNVTKIHGITTEMLKNKPEFHEISDKLIKFINGDTLVIHNAEFDIKFLKMEYNRLNKDPVFRFLDTLSIARKKFPGSSVSLDALCKRFNISLEERKFHGALLDASLLVKVYIELTKETTDLQKSLDFKLHDKNLYQSSKLHAENRRFLYPRNFQATPEEVSMHKKLLEKIKNPIWKKIEDCS